MNIVADKSIPFIRSFFNGIGKLNLLDSWEITPSSLLNADILIVRTVTQVNSELLQGTSVRFVATATSGHDHIDLEYLTSNDIGFAHAPGCNACSVGEYVLSSLFMFADQMQIDLQQKSIGIIGCGNVGSMLLSFIRELGMEYHVYDPPRQQHDNSIDYSTLDEVQNADIVTLHVPLTEIGSFPTSRFVNKDFLSRLRSNVILINTSRGGVVDEDALSYFIEENDDCAVALDVWNDEPEINLELLKKTRLSTPHIAGYSLDAKYEGTRAIFKQVCDAFATSYNEPMITTLPENVINHIKISECANDIDAIQMAVLASYDVRTDSAALWQLREINESDRYKYFLYLRNNYPVRREFTSMTVSTPKDHDSLNDKLENLGFKVTHG